MDENQLYQEKQEDAENDTPLTLDDALAAARAEMYERDEESTENTDFENAEETVDTADENAPDATSGNTGVERASNEGVESENAHSQEVNSEITALKQQLLQQNQLISQYQSQLQEQSRQMQALSESVSEDNNSNTEAVVQQLMTPPELDFNAIMYADEETQKEATRKFVDDTVSYAKESIMRELAPVVGEYRAREAQAQKISIKDKFRKDSQFEGFAEREDWMEQILQKNPELQKLPLDKQYEIAYLITQGVERVKARSAPAPEPKSVDEKLADIENDPELMRALEARRIRRVQRPEGTYPAFMASGGSSSVSLNVPSEPDTFDSARSQALSRILGRG